MTILELILMRESEQSRLVQAGLIQLNKILSFCKPSSLMVNYYLRFEGLFLFLLLLCRSYWFSWRCSMKQYWVRIFGKKTKQSLKVSVQKGGLTIEGVMQGYSLCGDERFFLVPHSRPDVNLFTWKEWDSGRGTR